MSLMSPRPINALTSSRSANMIAASAPTLSDPLAECGLTIEELRSDDVQLAIIELTLTLIMLDKKASAVSKIKAADKLAQIKGLDRNSQADEKLSAIIKLRAQLALDVPVDEKD